MKYDVGNTAPGLGQAQKCGRVQGFHYFFMLEVLS